MQALTAEHELTYPQICDPNSGLVHGYESLQASVLAVVLISGVALVMASSVFDAQMVNTQVIESRDCVRRL